MNLEVGKTYVTRGGGKVFVDGLSQSLSYPFTGFYEGHHLGWTEGGLYIGRETESEYDIVALAAETDYVTCLLPEDSADRKEIPLVTGVLDYFPLAIPEVARLSKAGSNKHNPGKPLHWDREKSTDHADCIGRHLIDRGRFAADGTRHSAALAWRALALLQIELESERFNKEKYNG